MKLTENEIAELYDIAESIAADMECYGEIDKPFKRLIDLVNKYIEDREAEASNPLYNVAGTVAGGLDES